MGLLLSSFVGSLSLCVCVVDPPFDLVWPSLPAACGCGAFIVVFGVMFAASVRLDHLSVGRGKDRDRLQLDGK